MTHATAFTPAEIGGLARRIDRPVVLVGLMGVGKSTVGRRLAALLDTDFIDVDEEIERAADRSVSEIFEAHGELYFRAGERRVIARLVEEGHGVIATGGGARRDSRPLLRKGDPRAILTQLKDQRGDAYAEAQVHVVTDDAPHTETALSILSAIDAWL